MTYYNLVGRTKILVQELTSKQSQIENCKQQKGDLEKELQRKNEEVKRTQLKLNDLVRQISSFHETLQTQRTALNDIKVSVRKNCRNITESYSKVVNTVALSCEKFAKDTKVLEESLSKVGWYFVKCIQCHSFPVLSWPFHSQDLYSSSPYCLPCDSYDDSSESLVLDQLIIP